MRLRGWRRWLHRHTWTLQITHARIDLYCPHCDTHTTGWDLTSHEGTHGRIEDDDDDARTRRRPTARAADAR